MYQCNATVFLHVELLFLACVIDKVCVALLCFWVGKVKVSTTVIVQKCVSACSTVVFLGWEIIGIYQLLLKACVALLCFGAGK